MRSVLDYASPVYHSMLNSSQNDMLEKLQRDIYKVIFGFDKSYRAILEENGLESLKERRQKLFDAFLLKMAGSAEYSDRWFPTKDFTHPDLRVERIYLEKYARTDRPYKSPLYAMRRRLNEISPLNFVTAAPV